MLSPAGTGELRIVAVGEILWDLLPTGRYLGGAPFNFTVHAARLGHRAKLVSAVGDDEPGRAAVNEMRALGAAVEWISTMPGLKTGTVTITVNEKGEPVYTIHHPAAYDCIRFEIEKQSTLVMFQPHWVYFGTLQPHSDLDGPGATLRHILRAAPSALRFYDVNLRPDSWDGPLVLQLLELADVVKLNIDEMRVLAGLAGLPGESVESFCRDCARRFSLQAICVTRGEAGCSVLVGERYTEAPGFSVKVADTVGAGDAFAAAFLHGFAGGWPAERIAEFANRAGALVASRPGGTPRWTVEDALALP